MRSFIKQKRYVSAVLLSLIFAPLVGCDSSSDDDNTTLTTSMTIPVTLDGMQAKVTTTAAGTASLVIDSNTGALTGSVTVTGLAAGNVISSAHIHVANPGASNTANIVALEAEGGASPATQWNIPANTMLTGANLTAFLAGGTYLNVHTTANAAGEVRGQILPTNYEMTMTTLSGDQVVPTAVTSALTATGYTLLNTSTGDLKVLVKLSAAAVNDQIHIHESFAGLSDSTLAHLQDLTVTTDATVWEATKTLTSAEIAKYKTGKYYFNLHTTANASGELRGQILPKNVMMVRTTLDGTQAGTASTGTAIAYLTVNESTGNDANANVRVTGITGTSVHIHRGASGVSGDSVTTLPFDTVTGTSLYTAAGTLSAADIALLKASGLYYNVHSGTFAAGELRGQIVP